MSNNSFDLTGYFNEDIWKDCFWTINDKIEAIRIVYRGITYKVNLQKLLDLIADAVEETTIINK